MNFSATKHPVSNRGVPPDAFLAELVAWGKTAADEIFAMRPAPEGRPDPDVYASIHAALGPWEGSGPEGQLQRRAAMLEILRVLAGFESSWRWDEGRDTTNSASVTAVTIEAGAWQVSANSMNFDPSLRALVVAATGSDHGTEFQKAMKANHPLAMEYAARLLRFTTHHNGPVLRHEIDGWLSRVAVKEFQELLQ
jgi:hypothetical protein